MASEDVIELGSSDEDSEPAPKKANLGKRRPDAMVQIPPGLTIKPPKPAVTNINPIKKLMGKGLTVTKVNSSHQPTSNIKNGQKPKPATSKMPPIGNSKPSLVVPVPIRGVFNPMAKKIKNPTKVVHTPQMSYRFPSVKIQTVKSLNSLPAGLTVSKTPGPSTSGIRVATILPTALNRIGNKPIAVGKRPAANSLTNVKKKQKVVAKQMLTVNLDDEEPPATSTQGPQWYLRPEDSMCPEPAEDSTSKEIAEDPLKNSEPSMEEQNNAEPNSFVEITIEDSPLKPVPNKRTHEIGAELAITIDDSPIKAVATKSTTSGASDDDNSDKTPKEKHSKKKLEYSKGVTSAEVLERTTIEIELEPIVTENDVENSMNDQSKKYDENVVTAEETLKINKNACPENNTVKEKNKKVVPVNDIVIEIEESPAKTVQTPPSTPKKDLSQRNVKVKPIVMPLETSSSEFHPVYQEFIDLCLKFENSNDMKTIIEKKIKNYYRQVPKDYTESEEFVDLVQSKIFAMRAGPDKLYLYIKDIVDELNLQRKMTKAKPTVEETRTLEAEKFQYGEESEFDSRRQRQIRKLEKTLKKLHRAIQKLEEQEVDFDDEEDSVYLLTERYKERMIRVHTKFCQLTNTKMPSEPRIQIQPRPGQPAGPARRLEKWVNRKVPIGKPLPFPDFHDVLKCVRDANNEDKLSWNEADVMEEARDLFTRCGKKLQRRRQENEWRLAASRISMETDPAENSEELKKKLESNKQMAYKKETEVFNKYADKQSLLKLEAVEIGDKEADESPQGESEDDEPQEESSTMENKERRKERLRRLIHEKSKKNENKENDSKNDTPSNETLLNEVNTIQKEPEKEQEPDSVPGNKKDGMDIDLDPKDTNDGKTCSKEDVHSISGDSKIDSEIDELHLLQKLHSDEVNTSTVDSSGSESPIDISDTLSSDNKKPSSDVISIENSSYSETEDKDVATVTDDCSNVIKEAVLHGKTVKATESILLATTDEDVDGRDDSPKSTDECVNLKDDAISIGETSVEGANQKHTETKSEAKISKTNVGTARYPMIKPSCKSAKNLDSVTENDPVLRAQQIDNENCASASSEEVAKGDRQPDETDIPSVETVKSDNSQEAFKKSDLELKNTPDAATQNEKKPVETDNPSVETLESDDSQETAKKSEDTVVVTGGRRPDGKSISAEESLESENSQEAIKRSQDVADVRQDVQNIHAVSLESINSQEAAKRKDDDVTLGNKEQAGLIENQNSQDAAD